MPCHKFICINGITNSAYNGNPMPISEFPFANALSFRSAMRKMETQVMGIKRLFRHWWFYGVVIVMEWR
jgi:hypothetical protein